jgi:hypothetical protein
MFWTLQVKSAVCFVLFGVVLFIRTTNGRYVCSTGAFGMHVKTLVGNGEKLEVVLRQALQFATGGAISKALSAVARVATNDTLRGGIAMMAAMSGDPAVMAAADWGVKFLEKLAPSLTTGTDEEQDVIKVLSNIAKQFFPKSDVTAGDPTAIIASLVFCIPTFTCL